MLRVVVRRLAWAPVTLLVVSFFVFALVDLAPTDPAVLLAGNNPDPALVAQFRHDLRLNDPMPVRYARWLGRAVHGDLGSSFFTREAVTKTIRDRMPINLSIAFLALSLSAVLGVVFGMLGAMRPGSWVDKIVTTASSMIIGVPFFWLALIMVVNLSVYHHLLPAIGYVKFSESPWEWLRHLIMPALALSTLAAAPIALQLKGSLIETLGQDYILAARAKGLTGRSIMFKHALRNAAIPVVTVFGLQAAFMLGGTAILEQVFAIGGLGSVAITAATSGDVNPILGIVAVTTMSVIVINALVDITYGVLNPKLRA